jgi:hypothetical protein
MGSFCTLGIFIFPICCKPINWLAAQNENNEVTQTSERAAVCLKLFFIRFTGRVYIFVNGEFTAEYKKIKAFIHL